MRHKVMMESLFVIVYRDARKQCFVNIETLVILSVYKLTQKNSVELVVRFELLNDAVKEVLPVNLSDIVYKSDENISEITSFCIWPVVTSEKHITAGLCSVARLLVKRSDKIEVRTLLGFREACLLACSESSVWTKFCEVDMIGTTKKILADEFFQDDKLFLPETIARFEYHMSKPVRMHNVYKEARTKNQNKEIKSSVPVEKLDLTHTYGEGTSMTLADVILYQCFKIFTTKYHTNILETKIPLTVKWIREIEQKELPVLFKLPDSEKCFPQEVIEPNFTRYSLYTADPERYRPEKRVFTKQNDIEVGLNVVNAVRDKILNELEPFGCEVRLDWIKVPLEVDPNGGALPKKRAARKREQLENLTKAVIKIVENKDKPYKIVDFCSGSGHLGLLLAVLLPKCEIILVENKERSLLRAMERIQTLELKNVTTIQSNLDYFHGSFDIGIALHACGVATDLVIQDCVKNNAHFVVCPCCYGGVKNCHHLLYPRSLEFQALDLRYETFLSLAHAADQTHDVDNVKTEQGFLCMDIVDTDRKLYAENCGYVVHLGKLQPVECTNKNNLLVGLYQGKN